MAFSLSLRSPITSCVLTHYSRVRQVGKRRRRPTRRCAACYPAGVTTLSAEDYHSLANEHRGLIWLSVCAIAESRVLISAARALLERSREQRDRHAALCYRPAHGVRSHAA